MAIDDLPGPVVTFLNVIGVPWPYINEDQMMQFASLVREFGQAYQGASTQALQSGWAHLSAQHVQEITAGCSVLGDALEAGAGWIVGQKVEAIAQLIEMAAEFVADQAASVATLGLAEAAVPVIIGLGKALMETLKQTIVQYLMGEIIEAAAKPLFQKVENAMSGLDWSHAPGGDGGSGESFSMDTEALRGHIATMRSHAETMRGHAEKLATGLDGLDF